MAAPEFSEFGFGFAYTYEVCNLWKDALLGAPHLPTQNAEGQAGGGFDVGVPTPFTITYFIQYKRGEHMTGKAAAHEDVIGVPHRRFKIDTREGQQHQLLLDLEGDGLVDVVEYVAPRFDTRAALDGHFSAGKVRDHVLRLRPSAIGMPLPDGPHTVTYRDDGHLQVFSEPIDIDPVPPPALVASGFEFSGQDDRVSKIVNPNPNYPTLDTRLLALGDRLASYAGVAVDNGGLQAPQRIQAAYSRARALAAVTLGADVLVHVAMPANFEIVGQ